MATAPGVITAVTRPLFRRMDASLARRTRALATAPGPVNEIQSREMPHHPAASDGTAHQRLTATTERAPP